MRKNDMLRNIEIELQGINRKLDSTNRFLSILIKKICDASTPKLPWLTEDKQKEAGKLREENPETYAYIMEVLKIFF